MDETQQHVFIEDIIYCPSQIYYYFWDQDHMDFWCAYIRQRRGPLTFELARASEVDGDFIDPWEDWEKIKMTREYDINNQPSPIEEDREILEIEDEVMCYLRQRFPGVEFPEHPERKTRRIN